eukprot:jgi/Mesvir1/12301/Mv00503-RA.1
MGTPLFPDLGKHCDMPSCMLNDFLPFKCEYCRKTYCLDHRSSHDCPGNKEDRTVILCPLCNRSVIMIAGEDVNVTWDRHARESCDPSNYEKSQKKPRCRVKGCKEVLTFSNKTTCRDCQLETCLKHRLPMDHACQGPPARPSGGFLAAFTSRQGTSTAAGNNNFSSSNSNASQANKQPLVRKIATPATTGSPKVPVPTTTPAAASQRPASAPVPKRPVSVPDPGNTLRGSAHRRAAAIGAAVPSSSGTNNSAPVYTDAAARAQQPGGNSAVPSWAVPTVAGGGAGDAGAPQQGGNPTFLQAGPGGAAAGFVPTREVCPQCSAAFDDVRDLIAHAEAYHPSGGGQRGGNAGVRYGSGGQPGGWGAEICPQCGMQFLGVVDLVTHVETVHSRGRAIAAGGGGDKSSCVVC